MTTPFNAHKYTLFDDVTTNHNGHADDHYFVKIKGGLQPRNPPSGSASGDAGMSIVVLHDTSG